MPPGARRRGGQGPPGAARQARLPAGARGPRLGRQPALPADRRLRRGGRLERYDAFMARARRADRRQVRRLAEGRARHRDQHGPVRRARVGPEGDRADVARSSGSPTLTGSSPRCGAQPRPGRAPAQPEDRPRDRGERHQVHRVRLLRAGLPVANVTTTPRQRIVLRREMARQPPGSPVRAALSEQYDYDGIETCAADGSCMTACPVAIDTGKPDQGAAPARAQPARRTRRRSSSRAATAWPSVPPAPGAAAGAAGGAARAAARCRRPAPARLPRTQREGAAAVYLPSCLNRIFGRPDGAPEPVRQACPRPWWRSRRGHSGRCGFRRTSRVLLRHALELEGLCRRSRRDGDPDGGRAAPMGRRGRAPVVMDASSCTLGLRENLALDGVEVIDSVSWVHDHLLERLEITEGSARS